MAIRPSGRRRSGAVLRTLPSDSTCRSRTPTRDCSHRLDEWSGRRNARKSPENDPVSAPRETGDEALIVVGQRVGPDLEIGSGIGEHHIEGDPSRPGIQEPVDQAGPYRLKQGPRKRRKLGASKARHRQWQRTRPARSGCRGARAGRSSASDRRAVRSGRRAPGKCCCSWSRNRPTRTPRRAGAVVSPESSLQCRMLQSPRSTRATLPNHDDQLGRSGLPRSPGAASSIRRRRSAR